MKPCWNILMLCLGIFFTQKINAQERPPLSAKEVLEILKHFPISKIVTEVENLKTDLKNCELTNARIIKTLDSTTIISTKNTASFKQSLNLAKMETDSLRKSSIQQEKLAINIQTNVKKVFIPPWLKTVLLIGGTATVTYFGTKK